MDDAYPAIYDFELLPYALGDVLTWNVQTAILCEAAGRARVEIHVCLDEHAPASPYQRDLVSGTNSGLFFSELFGAFGTHPKPGALRIWRRREELLEELRGLARRDAVHAQAFADYQDVLARRGREQAVIDYFTDSLHSHRRINEYARGRGTAPMLRPSLGCDAEVAELRASLGAQRVVTVHMRQRRVDAGFGAWQTYARDSDFFEWIEFLRAAAKRRPDVRFVVLGRLQEKPLEVLAAPNVLSLRSLGLGLGHELTLLLQSDLFLGTSSGFAAMANFSSVPYFITRVTPQSCRAYGIEPEAPRLPFAGERQRLVYEPETRELLARLLDEGAPA